MYPCNITGQCIDITKVCNGQQDCADGTDESSRCGEYVKKCCVKHEESLVMMYHHVY